MASPRNFKDVLQTMCFTNVLSNSDDFCSHQDQIDSKRWPSKNPASDVSSIVFFTYFGSIGKRQNQWEPYLLRVFCNIRWNLVATWNICCTMVENAFSLDFLLFFGRSGSPEKGLKPYDLIRPETDFVAKGKITGDIRICPANELDQAAGLTNTRRHTYYRGLVRATLVL